MQLVVSWSAADPDAPAPAPACDPYWSYVSLLLHMDGADEGAVFTDSSTYAHSLTVTGNTKTDDAHPKWGATCAHFDGTGDYLTTPSHDAFSFNTGDWTIETWVYQHPLAGYEFTLFDNRLSSATGIGIYTTTNSYKDKLVLANNAAIVATSSSGIPTQTWTHVAVTRQGTTIRGFIAGVLVFTYTDARTYTGSSARIGANQTAGQGFIGEMDDFRITKGVARYTADFTPPTAAFPSSVCTTPSATWANVVLKTNMESAPLVDQSSVGHVFTVFGGAGPIHSSTWKKYGAYSAYFAAGGGDGAYYITGPSSSWDFGTGDFTIEFWMNPSSATAARDILALRHTSQPTNYWVIRHQADGTLLAYSTTGGTVATNVKTVSAVPIGTGTHVAVVRSSGDVKIWLNGTCNNTVVVQTSNAWANPTATSLLLGCGNELVSNKYHGYLDELRIVKGQAVYTAPFAPPSSALPNS